MADPTWEADVQLRQDHIKKSSVTRKQVVRLHQAHAKQLNQMHIRHQARTPDHDSKQQEGQNPDQAQHTLNARKPMREHSSEASKKDPFANTRKRNLVAVRSVTDMMSANNTKGGNRSGGGAERAAALE
jgi:hypothetical protein